MTKNGRQSIRRNPLPPYGKFLATAGTVHYTDENWRNGVSLPACTAYTVILK